MKILAVIHAYNCARQISRVIRKFDERVSGLIQNVLIIENQSEDNTVNEAIKEAALATFSKPIHS